MDYEINDFIGVFDGVFGHKLCDRYIEHYKDLEENDRNIDRPNIRSSTLTHSVD